MLFSTTTFILIFLPIIIFLYYTFLKFGKTKVINNIILFVASIIFYAWGEPYYVIIMLLSIIVNWWLGILIEKYKKDRIKSKVIIVLMLLFNLGNLVIFKYLGFFISNINNIFDINIYIPDIRLPIGISFFTFQAISYVIDVYKNNAKVQRNLLNMGLYISFFPQLIAGPIVRYKTISEQIENRKESFKKFSQGVKRFIIGLAKKVLLSNSLAIVADFAFESAPPNISILLAWLGIISYTLQIYFDFSGYSDMAIGLAKMFGFELEENFNYPYISKSVTEFWRRWHISLGTWFKDYVYIPLGGNRVSKKRLIFNLFIVWLLTGLWHGANWTFIVWGLFYFSILIIEKITHLDKNESKNLIINILKHSYTIFLIIIGWVIFRSDNLAQSFEYIKSMIGISQNTLYDGQTILYLKEYGVYIILGIIFSIPFGKKLYSKIPCFILKPTKIAVFVLMFIISMSYIIKGTYNPFIYFNF